MMITTTPPALVVPPPMAERLVWIVVKSKQGQEIRAKSELKQQDFEVYLPMRLYQNRKGETRSSPFFPGYLFAHVSPYPQDWQEIYSTYGVSGVLGCTPTRAFGVKDRVIKRIKDQEEGGYIKMGLDSDRPPPKFAAGQRVAYSLDSVDLEAVFLEHVDAKRALILVSLFGRDSDVYVDLRQISPA